MKRVTIKDVAKEAGVSYATVSHVINETRHVEPETEERVKKALKKLDYSPNIMARSLRGGQSKTIGLIVPDTSNLFFAEIARKIEDIGFQQGYSVIIGNSDNDLNKQKNYIDTLIAKNVDGVIFISTGSQELDLEIFPQNKIPIVVADRDMSLEIADVVLLNNKEGGYIATRHLAELGHKKIGCITGPNSLSPSMERVEGYKKALIDFDIIFHSNLIEVGDFQFKGGEQATDKLLKNNPDITAIFVLNDMMAIGAMRAARRHGLVLPDDLSIVGFDNIELSEFITPSLTTIAQPFGEIASIAVRLLIERIQGNWENRKNQRKIFPPKLIIRESTIKRV